MAVFIWAVGAFLLVFITILLVAAKWRKNGRGAEYQWDVQSVHKEIAEELIKHRPLHSGKGWCLHDVRNGLRVFKRSMANLPHPLQGSVPHPLQGSVPHPLQDLVFATSLILDMSTKRSLSVACYVKEFSNWCPGWLPGAIELPDSSSLSRQLVQFDYWVPPSGLQEWFMKVKGWCEGHVPFLHRVSSRLAPPDLSPCRTTMELYRQEGSGCGYVFSYPRPPSNLPYLWSCLIMAPLREGATLATLVAAPPLATRCDKATVEFVAGQMCALRDYVALRRFKVYSSLYSSSASLRSTDHTHHTSSSAHHTSSSSHHTTSSSHDSSVSSHKQSHSATRNTIQKAGPLPTSNHTHQPVTSSRHHSSSTSGSQRSSVSDSASQSSLASSTAASRTSHHSHSGDQLNPGDQGKIVTGGDGKGSTSQLGTHCNGQVPLNHMASLEESSLEGSTVLSTSVTSAPSPSPPPTMNSAPSMTSVSSVNSVPTMNSTPSLNSALLASPGDSQDARYIEMMPELCDKLILANKEGQTEGWISLGTNKEVAIMKKAPGKGEVLGSFKGTGVVNAPPEFLLRLLADPDRACELDDMLKETRVITKITAAVHLVQLLYKPIWPIAARDFCMLSASGQLSENVWVSAAISVEDARVPVEKGYVRAHLEYGGYIIQSVPNKAEQSVVTYIGSVDLKGSIPGFVMNKVAESQPLCVSMLRKVGEPLYQKLKSQPQKLREMEDQLPILSVLPKKEDTTAADMVKSGSNVATEETGKESSTLPLDERLKRSQWHFDPAPLSPESRENDLTSTILLEKPPEGLLEEVGEKSGEPTTKDSSTGKFATPEQSEDEEWDTVLTDLSETDGGETVAAAASVKSVGGASADIGSSKRRAHSDSQLPAGGKSPSPRPNTGQKVRSDSLRQGQSSPSLLRRLVNGRGSASDSIRSDVSVTQDSMDYPRNDSGEVDYRTLANQTAAHVLQEVFHVGGVDICDPNTFTNTSGGWKFEGVEKDVVILSKDTGSDSSFTSFIGRGLIPLSPTLVFDSLRNPNLRFTYDNMLKALNIVQQMEKDLFIMHVHHETTQCFIKQARDFCILVSERSEQSKKLLVGTSVETSQCPINPGVHRGRVFCSGWVVQPRLVKGKLYTDITYILQVDLGSGVPKAILSLISKRQPLAVAYLRDYLVSTSLETSVRT